MCLSVWVCCLDMGREKTNTQQQQNQQQQIEIFVDAVNVKLCMMVLLTKFYPFIHFYFLWCNSSIIVYLVIWDTSWHVQQCHSVSLKRTTTPTPLPLISVSKNNADLSILCTR